MKVLIIIPELKCGGAERVLINYAKQLDKFEILFVNLGAPDGELSDWIEPQFSLISLYHNRTLSSFFSLTRLIKITSPDFIISSHTHVAVLLLIINIFRSFKLVIRMPTMPSNHLKKGVKIWTLSIIMKMLFNRAYKVIAQTIEMKNEIVTNLNVNINKVFLIPNPIDREQIDRLASDMPSPFDSNRINYLAVGNISYAKAYDTLIKAFAKIEEENDKSSLFIIGRNSSEYSKKIMSEAKELSCNIHFLGFQNNPYAYLKHCTVLVLSSRMEGFPNVVLEAMYLNKPISATRCVPIIDRIIIDGKNGYKAQVDNIDSLKTAMIKSVTITDILNEYEFENESSITNILI